MSCKEIDRLYAIGCYPVLIRICKTGCGTTESINKATVVHDYGGVLVQGTDITLDIKNFKELDPSAIDKVSTATTLVMSGTNTIKAPFVKVLVRNTSPAGTSITVNGGVVYSGESKSYSLDYFAEYTSDLVIAGGNYEVEVTKRALLPCLKDDVVTGTAVGAMTVVDVTANDTLCAGEAKTYSIVGTPTNATLVNNNGTFNVTPTAGACGGSWSYVYKTSCASGEATATVSGQIPNATKTLVLSTANESTVNLALVTSNASSYTVDWGDGASSAGTSSTTAYVQHTYAAVYTGNITITYSSCAVIKEFRSTAGSWTFDLSSLPAGLAYYINDGQNTTSGSIASLPAGMTYYYNGGQNTTSGSIASLPAGMTYYNNQGQNTTTFTGTSLPLNLTTFYDFRLTGTGSGFTQPMLDGLLAVFVANNKNNGRFDTRSSAHATPSPTGIISRNTLVSRGWLNSSNPATNVLTN